MNAHRRFGTIARWGACFALVLGLHAAGAMALLDWHADIAPISSGPAILIDLAPAPAAPAAKRSDLRPGPQQPQVQAKPEPKSEPDKPAEKAELTPAPDKSLEKAEAKPVQAPEPESAPEKPLDEPIHVPAAPKPDDVLTMLPPPRPLQAPRRRDVRQRHTKPRRQASLASAPSAAERRAARSVAPAPGAAHRDANAVPNWKSRLVARLERYKRYPDAALRRGEHGVAELAFEVDRRGGVHHVRILRSSGSSLLDHATLALARRAAPLPPPPAALSGRRIPIVVPIRYNIR